MTKLFTLFFIGAMAIPLAAQETTVSSDDTEETTVAAEADTSEADAVASDEGGLTVLDAKDVALDEFLWTIRPIVVFADTDADPRFQEQMDLLLSRPEELATRDVVVITDTDPGARTAVRTKFRPRGFQLTLVGKDGRVNLRKPFPWDVREITHAIDKWPLRQQEIRSGG